MTIIPIKYVWYLLAKQLQIILKVFRGYNFYKKFVRSLVAGRNAKERLVRISGLVPLVAVCAQGGICL